jgi:hypothetical protein
VSARRLGFIDGRGSRTFMVAWLGGLLRLTQVFTAAVLFPALQACFLLNVERPWCLGGRAWTRGCGLKLRGCGS